jgi:hypothetical protein
MFNRTRLKGLPVISREHFCKTRTNCYEILPCSILNKNTNKRPILDLDAKVAVILDSSRVFSREHLKLPIVTSNTNCYFKYQLLLQIPIVTSNTNCYFKYQNCYFKYQLLLQIPNVTSNTNCYFGCHE